MVITRAGSNTDGAGGGNITKVGLSTQVIIKVNGQAVGAIQTLSVKETRDITMVDEVGTDGHIDSSPSKSSNVSGSCKRVRFDKLRASQAFGRDFLHTHSQRIPFDIEIFDFWAGNSASPVVTTIKNVWISGLSYDYSSSDWLIFDNMDWVAETISSSLNGASAANGGTRGLILQNNDDERNADRGITRGGLDAPDLVDALFT